MRLSLKNRLRKLLALILALPYLLTFVYIALPPISTPMLSDWLALKPVKREWVPLKKISPNLIATVVSAEDGAFCGHYGFDFNQIEKSIGKAVEGKHFGGASTITQQTAKNLFLWNGRSWIRKILEAPLTVWLEIVWPKRRILEVYLNIAEWGPGIYGAEAAARHHFGTSAAHLSTRQASLLAAALPDPITRNARNPEEYQRVLALAIELRTFGHGADLSCVR
jgi:monofunctional glycosyltransferase